MGHEIKRCLLLGRKVMTNLDSILKSRDSTLPTTVHLVKAIVFPVVLYGCELGYEESWELNNWCFWTVVFEKTLESLLDCKEVKPVNPKGNQSWIFFGRTNAEWSSNPLATWCEEPTHWKRPWCWERLKTEGEGGWQDEMFGWHHWLNGHEFGPTLGDNEG